MAPSPGSIPPGKERIKYAREMQELHPSQSCTGSRYLRHIEYYDSYDCPVPYPYFFKQDYPCKGYQERSEGK